MGKPLDWTAFKFRKRPRPLVTAGEKSDNKLKAQQLARRLERGHKSPQVHRHGPVRQLSAEEVGAWAKANGYGVSGQQDLQGEEKPL